MKYVALGDSMSIDDYTGVAGGGAASQFAGLIRATGFQNLTLDGCTTDGVLENLQRITIKPDVATLTAGGNDFLHAAFYGADPSNARGWNALVELPLQNLNAIAEKLTALGCKVIMNTIYDPTDGDDSLGLQLGITASFRVAFHELNDGIRSIARQRGFLLSDLHRLFAGHGMNSAQTWIVGNIEPNYAGASAIAFHWFDLYKSYLKEHEC